MADPTMSIVGGAFKLSATATQAGAINVILATENKFVDKNIVIDFNVPNAASPALSITDKTNAVTVGTASGGSYPLSNSLTGVTSYETPGWVGTGGTGSATDSTVQVGTIAQSTMAVGSTTVTSGDVITPDATTNKVVTITAGYEGARTIEIAPYSSGSSASATVAITKQATTPVLADTASAQDGKIQIATTPTASVNDIDLYYLAVTANAPATTFVAADFTKTINQTGYLSQPAQITTSGNISSNSKLYYIPLGNGAATVYASQAAAAPTADTSNASVSGKTRLSITPTTNTSDIGTYYIPITLTAPTTTFTDGNITKTITSSGYLTSTTQVTANIETTSTTSTYYLPVTSGALSSGAGAVDADGTNGNVTTSVVTSAPAGYYITITGSGTVNVGTAGWLPDTGNTSTKDSDTATKYVSLNTAALTENQATGTVTVSEGYVGSDGLSLNLTRGTISTGTASQANYTNNTSAIVPANGYLYINAGYYPNTQISLGTLIPDDVDYINAANANILQGYEAYDSDGNKLIGSIATYNGAYSIS